MTELDDDALPFLFAQPAQRLTPEQVRHTEAVQEFEKREILARIELVQKFAPVLCTCAPWYDRWRGHPPQVECPVHSMMMAHPYTGLPILPGVPLSSGAFTPPTTKDHDEGTGNGAGHQRPDDQQAADEREPARRDHRSR